jgi:hypothetical protein
MARRSKRTLYCTFCRKADRDVAKLIAGPGVYICDTCVGLCSSILEGRPIPHFPGWGALSDDALLATLAASSAVVEDVRAVLQRHVEALRARGVSWTRIGAALGISRQAAWERFS